MTHQQDLDAAHADLRVAIQRLREAKADVEAKTEVLRRLLMTMGRAA